MSTPFPIEKEPCATQTGDYATVFGNQAPYPNGENLQMQPTGPYAPQPYAPQPYGAPPPGMYPAPGGPPPITNQPGAASMNTPNCPPGLEYLACVDQLLVHQQVEILEVLTGFETNNKYEIKNSLGQKVYYAVEDTDCCTRQFCGPHRPFEMKILDAFGNEVIHLNRPLACDNCCCPCCLQKIEVSSPPGTVIGTVEQNWSLCTADFSIKNASGETILKIYRSLCKCHCCGDIDFQVLSPTGKVPVGKISKQWTGLAKELFTDADNFGVTFPLDLDVTMKAVCLGAVFLIDMMYFENNQNNGLLSNAAR